MRRAQTLNQCIGKSVHRSVHCFSSQWPTGEWRSISRIDVRKRKKRKRKRKRKKKREKERKKKKMVIRRQPRVASLFRSLWKVSEVKWSHFLVLYFFETFIFFRGVLNLNCYISKKVQKNFVMGLKSWWSWGSRIFFIFSCKTSGFCGAVCSLWFSFKTLLFFFSIKKNPNFFRLWDFWNFNMF